MQHLIELNDRQMFVIDVALAVLGMKEVMETTNGMLASDCLDLNCTLPPAPAERVIRDEDIGSVRRAMWLD